VNTAIRLWLILAAFLAVTAAHAQNSPGVSPNQMAGCNQSVIYDASYAGATQIVAADATGRIYVCGFTVWSAGTVNVDLVYGTGTNCSSGTTQVGPAFQYTAQTGFTDHQPVYTGITPVPAGNNLCINTSQGVAVQAVVYLTQFP
jgi:hypothetical protein